MNLRSATNQDSDAIIAVVDACYRQYPYQLYVEDEPELLTPADSFSAFWVAEDAEGLVGCIAGQLLQDATELKKFYAHPRAWGTGLAQELHQKFVQWTREEGRASAVLWTDVLFHRAHKFYKKQGWVNTGKTRDLADTNGPFSEYLLTLNNIAV